jgi:hypothetical protein
VRKLYTRTLLQPPSALFTFRLARNARAYTSDCSIGFYAIWVCSSSSSSSNANAHRRRSNFCIVFICHEHSEQARAPHTNGPRDVPRIGALSLLQKPLCHMGIQKCYCPPFVKWALTKFLPVPASTAKHLLRDHVCSHRPRHLHPFPLRDASCRT